jgi:hypothetical protein
MLSIPTDIWRAGDEDLATGLWMAGIRQLGEDLQERGDNVEAGLTDREVRRAMEAGIDAPEAIIIFCKRTPEPGHSAANHPSEHT